MAFHKPIFSFPPMPAVQPSMPQRNKPRTLHCSTWFFCLLLACALMLMCGRASAQLADDAVQRGAAWLQAQVLASGHLTGEDASPALPAQARFETALTLHTLEHEVPPALLAALEEAAEEAQEQATEYLAYRALAAQLGAGSDDVAIQALLAMQGADGGFGTGEGGASNALDTAWALRALSAGDEAAQALAWLASVQQADGSWALAPEGDACTTTALVVQALTAYRTHVAPRAALAKARAWLLGQQAAWESAACTAHALLAVLPGLDSAAAVQGAVDALRHEQGVDGSWSGDPWLTALVLRALHLAAQPATNPDLASISGQVIDEEMVPIAGALVRLEEAGQQTSTDTEGRFAFTGVVQGSEQLLMQAEGYLGIAMGITVYAGQALELGTIAMQPRISASSSEAVLAGIASFSEDGGATWQRAADATVSVGALSTKTNAQGEYTLSGVPLGVATVRAAYANYPSIVASFTARAGQQIRFDPQFVRNTASSTLTVSVSSLQSAAPLEGASVVLNGIQRQTDAEGKVYFSEGVSGGENVVNVSAPGHETRIITFSIEGQQHVKLPVTLAEATSLPPDRVVLEGTVTDAATALPLSGASVRVLGTGHEAVTDERGRYSFDAGSAGSHKVLIEKAGYQRHAQTLKLASGVLHQFDVPLAAVPSAGQPTRMLLLVTDAATHQAVAGASISMSGSNPHEEQTDAAGEASFTGLNSGATQFQVTAPGYDAAVFFIDVQAGQNYRVPVELRATAPADMQKIYGTVLDAQSRRPINGARVTLAGVESGQVTTDAQGHYEIAGVAPGVWGLSAGAQGYKRNSRNITIQGNTQTDIALAPDKDNQLAEQNLRTVVAGHANGTNAAAGYLFIFGIPGTSGSVVSNDKGVNDDFTIDASGVAEIMVPSSQFLNQSGTISEKSLFIYASNPVSASFLNREIYSTDISYLLDTSALGNEYRIVGWEHAFGMLQFSLTALEDGTVATVTPASPLSTGQVAGESFNVELQKGQSVLYTSTSGNDLTGSLIVANKPLAVFSGAQCSNVPQGFTACDHLFTQLPPVQHWAREYIVAETANTGNAGNLVRIIAHTDGTQIRLNGDTTIVLNAGQFHEILSAGDLHIETSHPVLVAQFLKGYSQTGFGDPAFSFIAGIHQTLKDYVFTAPVNLASYEQNFLNLTVPDSALNSLELNGASVDTSNFRSVPGTGYSTGRVEIEPGVGRMTANQKFLVTISGFTRHDSYHTIIGANYSAGASAPELAVVALAVATDQPSYPEHSPVRLSAQVDNKGADTASLQLVLRINDAQGFEVARFEHSLGILAADASVLHEQPWNTVTQLAGNYTLVGQVLDENGSTVAAASTPFASTAGSSTTGGDTLQGALSVATDKAEYQSGDLVQLNTLARNLTTNAIIDAARVHLRVFDPNGKAVFEHEHTIGQMSPGALRELDARQPLRDALLGAYTVQATLHGRLPGQQKLWQKLLKVQPAETGLAHASASYRVVAAPKTPLPSSSGATPASVPASSPASLALLALAVAGAAGRARSKQQNNKGKRS